MSGFRPVSNWTAGKLPVVTCGNVPISVSRESQDRSLADMVRGAKADLQIAGSFSLTQQAPVQRKPTATTVSLRVAQLVAHDL